MNSKVVFAFLITVSVALALPHHGRDDAAPPAAIVPDTPAAPEAPVIPSEELVAATSPVALLDDATAQPVTLPASQDSLPVLEAEQPIVPVILPGAATIL